jgi:hypothetical protein
MRVVSLRHRTLVPIAWIGRRRFRPSKRSRPFDLWPIRIHAGAFEPSVPHRDLFLSTDHAVFVNGVLIPVGCLINGTSVVRTPCDKVEYFHVELAEHGVLLADGLPCESYLDTGNRSAFVNGGPAVDHSPDFARHIWEAKACAAQIRHGPILAAVRARLRTRAPDFQRNANWTCAPEMRTKKVT